MAQGAAAAERAADILWHSPETEDVLKFCLQCVLNDVNNPIPKNSDAVGVFPVTSKSLTPARGPLIQLNSNTVHLEVASGPRG